MLIIYIYVVAFVSDFSECTANQFKCANNHCISNLSKCNGRRDCLDGSDEVECPPAYADGRYCRSDQFTCQNHVRIGWDWSCSSATACIVHQGKNLAAVNSVVAV